MQTDERVNETSTPTPQTKSKKWDCNGNTDIIKQ
jgi:hypothetical protein